MNTAEAIAVIRETFRAISAEERLKIIGQITEGYCDECGNAQPKSGRPCQCWNDE